VRGRIQNFGFFVLRRGGRWREFVARTIVRTKKYFLRPGIPGWLAIVFCVVVAFCAGCGERGAPDDGS
jgi:hypothetical protein